MHLKPYLRGGSIVAWSDKQIVPGSTWFGEIKSALLQTNVAVLLVTPAFLASKFIHEHELGPILKEAERGGVTILWVPIYASAYKQTALEKYQAPRRSCWRRWFHVIRTGRVCSDSHCLITASAGLRSSNVLTRTGR